MSKPTPLPTWGTDPATPIETPPAGLISGGWRLRRKPSHKHVNWWWNLVGRWFAWLDPFFYDDGVIEAWRIRPGLKPGDAAPDYQVVIGGYPGDARDGGLGLTAIGMQGGATADDRGISLVSDGDLALLLRNVEGILSGNFDLYASGRFLLTGSPTFSDEGFGYRNTSGAEATRYGGAFSGVGKHSFHLGPHVGTWVQVDGPALARLTPYTDSGIDGFQIHTTATGTYRFRMRIPGGANMTDATEWAYRGIRLLAYVDGAGSSLAARFGYLASGGVLFEDEAGFPDRYDGGGATAGPHAIATATNGALFSGIHVGDVEADDAAVDLPTPSFSDDRGMCVEVVVVVANTSHTIAIADVEVGLYKNGIE